MRETLSELICSRRVIVCCGSGGVGKTTASAAIAMRAAMDGLRAVVITIDPAKRLATSLGLKALAPDASDLTSTVNSSLEDEGLPPLKGRFFAVMPDTAQTFEGFVRAIAGKNANLAQRVLHTSIYKIFAKEYSGTNEYMAMEKLYELYSERGYDLIVLDTPPSSNTRAFLDAPRLLADFFDDRIMKWIIAPGSRFVAGGLRKLLEILESLTGRGFISDLIEFTTALFELRAQFMENLGAVTELLHQKDVAFLMVTSPERLSKTDTQEFTRLLEERGYRLWGFIVNRVIGRRLGIGKDANGAGSAVDVERLARELESRSKSDAAELALLRASFQPLLPTLGHELEAERFLASQATRHGAGGVALFAEQATDVHSVSALIRVCREI